MAFTPRTETYVNVSSLTTPFNITVTKPTGTVDGDILFCWIGWYAAVTIDSVPSGWNLLGQYIANTDRYALYYKIASGEGASWAWSFTATAKVRAVCSCYTSGDFNASTPIDVVSNTAYRTSDANCRAASMDVAVANSPLMFWGGCYATTTKSFTKPSVPTTDWVEDDDGWSTTPDMATEVCSFIWAGSGATGAMSATISATMTAKHAFAVALKPPAGAPQTLSNAGAIASLQAFGTAKLNLILSVVGQIATAVAFGMALIVVAISGAEGIASQETFGQATVATAGATQAITNTGHIAGAEAFGTSQVNLKILPTGIQSTEDFGTPQINFVIASVGNIGTTETFGTHALIQEQFLGPSSILSTETLGSPQLNFTVLASSISSTEEFGTATLVQEQFLEPNGIASVETWDQPNLTLYINPTSIEGTETFGTAIVSVGATTQDITNAGAILSDETHGSTGVNLSVSPSEIASAETFGTAQVNLQVLPNSIAGQETFGQPLVTLASGPQAITNAGSITSQETFDNPQIVYDQSLEPTSIASQETFGIPSVGARVAFDPRSITATLTLSGLSGKMVGREEMKGTITSSAPVGELK